jgi:hypothetical protein
VLDSQEQSFASVSPVVAEWIVVTAGWYVWRSCSMMLFKETPTDQTAGNDSCTPRYTG